MQPRQEERVLANDGGCAMFDVHRVVRRFAEVRLLEVIRGELELVQQLIADPVHALPPPTHMRTDAAARQDQLRRIRIFHAHTPELVPVAGRTVSKRGAPFTIFSKRAHWPCPHKPSPEH